MLELYPRRSVVVMVAIAADVEVDGVDEFICRPTSEIDPEEVIEVGALATRGGETATMRRRNGRR